MDRSNVSVVGLGNMGSALAECLIDKGVEVSVWNRTAAKAARFAGRAAIAESAAAACSASDLTVVCLPDYETAQMVLDEPAVANALRGKLLVQITSGTPADARSGEAWANKNETGYLDAAIITYPAFVGSEGVIVLYSGAERHFAGHRAVLTLFGGRTRYLGPAIGAAAALDCALLEFMYASVAGALHGAALCAAEDLPLGDYFEALAQIYPLIEANIAVAGDMVPRREYAGEQCSVGVHLAAIRNIQQASQDCGLAGEIPDALVRSLSRAVTDGREAEELPATFEGQLHPE